MYLKIFREQIYARKIAESESIPFISPYNDRNIIAGQGTFACIGGGGMISGIADYVKAKNKNIKIVGCEPKNSCAMSVSIKAGN